MTDRSRAYQSHERAIERVFQLGLAVTSLRNRTDDLLVQERLAGITAELDDVIAELRSVTFDEAPNPALPNMPPGSTANGRPAA